MTILHNQLNFPEVIVHAVESYAAELHGTQVIAAESRGRLV